VNIAQLRERAELFEEVVEACSYILHHDPVAKEAKSYLDSRIPEEAQKRWGFGYFPADENLGFLRSLVDEKELDAGKLISQRRVSGAISWHGHFHHHNLIMPFRDDHGDIVALLGRSLLSDEQQKELGLQKYKYTLGSSKDLYVFGLDKARDAILKYDCAIGVEGQFDSIALHCEGVENACAFGWAHTTRYQLAQILRYTRNVILMYDNDEAGQKAKVRTKKNFGAHANLKTVSPPKGYKDIEEFLRKTKDLTFRSAVIAQLKSFNQERDG
jgi:DNA primase